jgi:frataxin-like iron-binding protein CyaY
MEKDHEFLIAVEAALNDLKHHLNDCGTGDLAGFGLEEQDAGLAVRHPVSGKKFLVTHHTVERQIWVSAPGSDFQLNWDSRMEEFILPSTGETIIRLFDRLLAELP